MTDPTPTWQDVIDDHHTAVARATAGTLDPNQPSLDLPVSDVVVYQTMAITEVAPTPVEPTELTGPVDLLGPDAEHRAEEPAVGVILDIEQAWRVKGMATGRLLHSMALAPGEVTQVAMVDWDRHTGSSSSQDIGEHESASRAVGRSRDIADITHMVGDETSAGASSASSFSSHSAAGVGGLLGFLGGANASGASSHSSSVGVNWSTGTRSATADARQHVQQSTAQHAANARSRTATLVQEVGQSSSERFTSRVVANYNHMHSLNMQYYEVLQVYELAARPVRAERCLFLPMEVMAFTVESLVTHVVSLANGARAMGRPRVATIIEKTAAALRPMLAQVVALQQTLRGLNDELDAVRAERAAVDGRFGSYPAVIARYAEKLVRATTLRLELDDIQARLEQAIADQAGDTPIAGTVTTPLAEGLEGLLPKPGSSLEVLQDQLQAVRERRARVDELEAVLAAQLGELLGADRLVGIEGLGAVEALEGLEGVAWSEALARLVTGAEERSTRGLQAGGTERTEGTEGLAGTEGLGGTRGTGGAGGSDADLVALADGVARDRARLAEREQAVESRIGEVEARLTELAGEELRTAQPVIDELNEDRLALNQAMWLQMTPAVVGAMIADKTHLGERIVDTLDPVPLTVVGNYVGFRWGFPATADGAAAKAEFDDRYLHGHLEPALDTHVVATRGQFGEAVLGRSNAGEKLDLTRFWKWDADTIPILPTPIEAMRSISQARRAEAKPGQLGRQAVSASQLPAMPAGPSHALTGVIAASMFRDMSGGAGVRELLEAGQKAAAQGTDDAMQQAHENISNILDHVEQLLPQVLDALEKSGVDPSKLLGMAEGGGEGGLDPSSLGALKNAVGEGAEMDPEALLGIASEIGMLL